MEERKHEDDFDNSCHGRRSHRAVGLGAGAGHAEGLPPVSGRQGRRARRHGADDRQGSQGRQCRPRHPGLSRRLAVQAERPVERHGQRPARHHAVPARLRQRQGAGLQRDADARPDPQPGTRQAHQQFAIHEGHPRRDREAWRDRAVRRLVCRRHGVQQGLPRAPGRPERPEIPRRRTDLRRDVGSRRRQHRQPAVERNLQRVPERRRQCHRHQPRHLRSRCGSTK